MSVRAVPRAAAASGASRPADHGAGSGLTVLARSRWPERPSDTLTPVAAFVASSFNPLVAEVAERCLRARYGRPPVPPSDGEQTAVVLATRRGDVGTAAAMARAVAAERRVPPLLFFQSNINAVVGHITARWGLAGPVVCTSPLGDPLTDGLLCADLLLRGGEAAQALVIVADQAYAGEPDHAAAVLVTAAQPRGGRNRGAEHEPPGGNP